MSHVNLLIGNSSSGIIESASFGKSTINIGNRQAGRMKGNNVIDSSIKDLNKSIKLALSLNFIKQCRDIKNIYGIGEASIKIVKELINQPLSAKKFFIDTKL